MGEPVKFEAGMVVKWRGMSKRVHVVIYAGGRMLQCSSVDGDGTFMEYAQWFEPVSPAPRAGDTWTSGDSVARIEANGAQLRIVSEREPFVGDVVAVARKLWEGGYRFAKRFTMPAMAAPAHAKSIAEAEEHMRAARIAHASVDGRAVPVARTLRDGRTAYVTLDDMKECAPASLSAFDGTWPVFTPSADVDGGIHPTRDGVERVIESLRAAEQKYAEAKQRAASADTFANALKEADDVMAQAILGPSYLALDAGKALTVTLPPLAPGLYTLSMDPQAGTAELRGANETDAQLRERLKCRFGAERAYPREYDGEFREPPPRAGDVYEHTDGTIVEICEREWRHGLRTHVLRAAVAFPLLVEADEPAALAALLRQYGYARRDSGRPAYARPIDETTPQPALDGAQPELRAGMVVRGDRLGRDAIGYVEYVDRRAIYVRWSGDYSATLHQPRHVRPRFVDGRWRIVEPNVAPLASLAYAVAAIAQYRADRVTPRQHVDAAVARLRGEPFAHAVQAALVGVSERANLTPAEVAAAIAALRHWEARRPFGGVLRPEAHASLSRSSTEALRGALGYAPVWDTDLLFSTYERARSSR